MGDKKGPNSSDSADSSSTSNEGPVVIDVPQTQTTDVKEPQSVQTPPPITGPVPLPPKQLFIVFTGLFFGILMASLDQTIVSTALPAISDSLGGLEQISWIFVAYLLTSTAMMPTYGKLGDVFGRKRVYLFAVVSFMLGSLLCGVAVSMPMLIIARAIQGIGGGGLIALVMIIIADIVPLRDRGKYQGIIGGTFAISSVIGPLIGGVFVDNISWRWIFFINLPIGALCFIIVSFGLKLTPIDIKKIKKLDFFGTMLVVAAVICAVLALNWGGTTYPWKNGIIITLFIGAFAIFVCFVVWEVYLAKEPIMAFRLFKIRNVVVGSLGNIFVGYPMMGCISYLPLYFQIVQGKSATDSGVQMIPMMFGVIIGSVGSGFTVSKTGKFHFFPMIGLALATIGLYLLSLLDATNNLGKEIGFLFVEGLGIGLCVQTFLIGTQSVVGFKDIAIVTAGVNFFRTVGGVFGVAVYGAIFNAKLGSGGGITVNAAAISALPPAVKAQMIQKVVDALSDVFLYAIPVAGVGFLVSLFFQHHTLRRPPPPGGPGGPGGPQQNEPKPESHMVVEL